MVSNGSSEVVAGMVAVTEAMQARRGAREIVPPTGDWASDEKIGVVIGVWLPGLPEKPDGILATAQSALLACRTSFGHACEAHDRIMEDPLSTELQRQSRSRRAFHKKMQSALPM